MKRLFLLAFGIFLISPVFASDVEFNFDAPPDANFMGQKQITDQDFEKTLKELEGKQKKNKKKKFKGMPMKTQEDVQQITEIVQEPNILNLPVNVILDNGDELPSGHYKVVGKKTRKDTVVELHQGHFIMASLPINEVDDDFDEKGVSFVRILPYGPNQVRLIYGSIDFNGYVILNFAQ